MHGFVLRDVQHFHDMGYTVPPPETPCGRRTSPAYTPSRPSAVHGRAATVFFTHLFGPHLFFTNQALLFSVSARGSNRCRVAKCYLQV